MIETALGASSSYVTSLPVSPEPALLKLDYAARHVTANAKNFRQAALVAGIGFGAFLLMKMSGTAAGVVIARLG